MGSDNDGDGVDEDDANAGCDGEIPVPPSALIADTDVSMDELLDLLASRERRVILKHLAEMDGVSSTLTEVVDVLVDFREDESGRRPSLDQMEGTFLHVHLPKFEETGIAEYDERSEELRYHVDQRLEAWLTLVEHAHDAEQ